MSIVANKDFRNRIANNVDPDETARHEPSHPDLHRLHRPGLKGIPMPYYR